MRQDSPYMLDEVVVRITYVSDWEEAEHILMDAAVQVTKDIIEATGMQPYIRSDLYDYGVFLRLRYMTKVKDRVEIAYKINRAIFENVQGNNLVDIAIPFIYSYKAGADKKEYDADRSNREQSNNEELPITTIEPARDELDKEDIQQLAKSIAANGLMQPIVVAKRPGQNTYKVLAGHLRCEACRLLGWKNIPAIVRDWKNDSGRLKPLTPERPPE